MLPVRFTDRAWREYVVARAWWRENRDKPPDAFVDEVAVGLHLIRRDPGVGQPIRYGRYADARRIHLDRVRYYIYYRVAGDVVRIQAIRHSSRRSSR